MYRLFLACCIDVYRHCVDYSLLNISILNLLHCSDMYRRCLAVIMMHPLQSDLQILNVKYPNNTNVVLSYVVCMKVKENVVYDN